MRRILIGKSYTDGIAKAFENKDFYVYRIDSQIDMSDTESVCKEINLYHVKYGIEYCFTLDFYSDVAKQCHSLGIKYISWVWDCPHSVLWAKEAKFDTNYIFVFDSTQCLIHRDRGLKHIYYLPIASDIEFFDSILNEVENKTKPADVSFVGNLYNSKEYSLFDQINYLPPYIKGYLDALMDAQKNIWGADLISSCVKDNLLEELHKYIQFDVPDNYENGFYRSNVVNIIGQKIAQIERVEMCSFLARCFDFILYSDSDTSYDPKIINAGHADYQKCMPLVFKNSKININITSRSIPTGIPLRVIDVLSCGGFLMTNYQEDLLQYFEDGKDLVVYSDLQDMYNKITYYLQHEEERISIAEAGNKRVREQLTFSKQIGKIVEILDDEN